ncbi:MAG: hypothetical protein U0746_17805 [Gemmataceae bacterium]
MPDDTTTPGYFRWNAGGWFGGQLGGTAWLFVGAVVLVPSAIGVAVVWLACFTVANVVGAWLWFRRDRIRAYPAIQLLLVTCGVSGLVAWLALDALGSDAARVLASPRQGYLAMLIVPAMMAWFAVMEHAARSRAMASRTESTP